MEQQELISIIIAVYNIADYLPKCIETVAAQSYKNLEIILVNDGSTDNSGYICDAFAQKDKRAIVLHNKNCGLWAARNSGQKKARGSYLMFVDGDDYLHLDAVNTLYHAINYNKSYDIAIIDYKKTQRFDEDIISKRDGEVMELSQKELISGLFNGKISRNVWTKLYRKELIQNLYANNYERAQDFDFNIRAFLKADRAIAVHHNLYFYLQRPTSCMNQHDYWKIAYSCIVKMLYVNYINLPIESKQYSHYLLSNLYKSMIDWEWTCYNGNDEPIVLQQCSKYERNTRKEYWTNWHINPIEKIIVSILLHNPKIMYLAMELKRAFKGHTYVRIVL